MVSKHIFDEYYPLEYKSSKVKKSEIFFSISSCIVCLEKKETAALEPGRKPS